MENRIQEILRRDEDAVGELMELITEYQARAWDKGFDKGTSAYSGFKRIYDPVPEHNANRNPYRFKQSNTDE